MNKQSPFHMVEWQDEPWFWWVFMLTITIGPFILLFIFITHCIKVYQDLLTSQRKSVQWRPAMPIITKQYGCIAVLVCLSYLLFFLSSMQGLTLWSYFDDYCKWLGYISSWLYVAGKQLMYFVFLLRLKSVYLGSSFEYSSRKLIFVAIFSTIITIINSIFFVYFTEISVIYFDQMPYAMQCDTYYSLFILISIGMSDTIICVGFLIAFVVPLTILIKTQTEPNVSNELLDLGIKSFILTAFASLSTLIFLLSLVLTNSLILSTFDIHINCYCMLLMMPYYPNPTYYNRICYLCIKLTKCIIGYKEKKMEINMSKIVIKQHVSSTNSTPTATTTETQIVTHDNTPISGQESTTGYI